MRKVSIIELLNFIYKILKSYNPLIDKESEFVVHYITYFDKNIYLPVYIHSTKFELVWTSIYNIETEITKAEILSLYDLIDYCKLILEIL